MITNSLSCHTKEFGYLMLFLLSVCLFSKYPKIGNEYLISYHANVKKANLLQWIVPVSYGRFNVRESIIWTVLANDKSK